MTRRGPAWRAATGLLMCGLMAFGAACREDAGGVKVTALRFEGNDAFGDATLSAAVSTRASGWLPWSRTRYFHQDVLDADLVRLRAFYADRGYPDARVTDAAVAFNDARTSVAITIHLDEGEPILVERIAFDGLGAFAPEMLDAVSRIPLRTGQPRDRLTIAESRERVLFVLRDRGYPDAHVEVTEAPGSTPRQVVITFVAGPGPAASFGDVEVVGLNRVDEKVVRRALAFRPGDVYRESEVLESQRRLASLGVFDFALVTRRTPAETAAPGSPIPMTVTVTEAKPTRLQFGVGYGSEDGPRGSMLWRHANLFGDARQFTADAKYSNRLRALELDLSQPYVGSSGLSAGIQAGARWSNEPTYTARTYGGRGTLTWRSQVGRGLHLEPIDHVVRVTYLNESLRYDINPRTLADLTQFEELIALGFDPITGTGSGRLAAIDLDVERTLLDDPFAPRRGHSARLHVEHAAPWLGGTYDYTEVQGEARLFVPIGRTVWANRARAGLIRAATPDAIPFSARYFLGGSNTLRGWGRFQVAPITADGLPIGGEKLVDLSSEWRVPLGGAFGAVAFVDAGNVWSNTAAISLATLRVDVGPGLRWTSPVGVVRADLGIQLTPIDGLVIAGQPERRRWRIHFSIGHAF